MRKGFTLIELLAVIVILAIILVIAVPQIMNVIEESKINTYNNQIKLVEDAARIYHTANTLTFTNNQSIIKISDLQSSKLLESNIKDTRTGSTISPDSWVLVTRNGDTYTYTYGYDTGSLILYYDGINNGGLNIHNDNTSTNKAIWTDLSGNNNNNGALTNFGYTSSSGWTSNSLKFDGVNDLLGSNVISTYTSNSFTIEIVLSRDSFIYSDLDFGVAQLKLRTSSNNEYWNTKTSTSSYQTINMSYPSQTPLSTKAYYSFVYDHMNNKYNNFRNNNVYTRSVSEYLKPNIRLNFPIDEPMSGDIYAIRVYNRALSNNEIKHNYEVDKLRFGL